MRLISSALALLASLIMASCSGNGQSLEPDAELAPDVGLTSDARMSDGAAPRQPDQAVIPIPSEPDLARLKKMLETLAADDMKGRLTGAPSGAKAETYVIERMTASGLQVKTQDVTLPIWDPGSPIDLSIVDAAGKPQTTLKYITEYREVRFSGSGSVTGELHFVGYGEDADYQGIDVAGKVVAMLTSPPSANLPVLLDIKIQRAHQKGAIGIVFVPSGVDAKTDAMVAEQYQPAATHSYGKVDTTLLVASMPVLWLHVGVEKQLFGKTTAELVATPTPFDSGKRVHVEVHGTTIPSAVCKNVFGILPGVDPALQKEVVIVGGHYDHIGPSCHGKIFNGAADNASGSSVVLEAALSFGKVTSKPRRTIVFALWCGEEQGIHGSYSYVKDPLFPLSDTVLTVNLDYIGDTYGPYWLRDKKVPLQEEFMAASADQPIEELKIPFQCGSDECPFQIKNVAFLRFLSQGSHHHVLTDTFENLTMPNVEKVARAVFRGLARVGY